MSASRVARTLVVLAGIGATAAAFALFTRLQSPWVALSWCALVPWLAVLERTPTLGGAVATAWALSSACDTLDSVTSVLLIRS